MWTCCVALLLFLVSHCHVTCPARYQAQGIESRSRLRLPEAGLFAKMLQLPGWLWPPGIQTFFVSAPASASLNPVLNGFGFGIGFVKLFSAGFWLGFSFPEFLAWVPRFNGRFDKTSIHKLRFDLYLPVGDLFRLHPLVAPHMPSLRR